MAFQGTCLEIYGTTLEFLQNNTLTAKIFISNTGKITHMFLVFLLFTFPQNKV